MFTPLLLAEDASDAATLVVEGGAGTTYTVVGLVCALAALVFAWLTYSKVMSASDGDEKMREIAKAIQDGAMAFLTTEYKILSVFVVVVAGILMATGGPFSGLCFFAGATCSAIAGWIGMRTATAANVRTTEAAKSSLSKALDIAFSSGMVMGLTVVGLGLLGVTAFKLFAPNGDPAPLFSFGFGASSIALFARVGGGIFTKAADVGADLVGKVEAGIPEDDPRNPATIADNVGDNVGDVAGMGADLFESYVGSIIASMAIAFSLHVGLPEDQHSAGLVALPVLLAGVGIIASYIGRFFVKTEDEAHLHGALFKGLIVASLAFTVFGSIVVFMTDLGPLELAGKAEGNDVWGTKWGLIVAILSGLVCGVAIGKITEYYTSEKMKPAQEIARQSLTGAATNLIHGLAIGMASCALPTLCIVVAILLAFHCAGLFGIAIAAVGMLSTLGISLGVDAYGPVADNAGGISEMSGQDPSVRERTDALDAAGNTTAAIGKGFAIGSAALTSLALFNSYCEVVKDHEDFGGMKMLNLLEPEVLVGLLIGAMLPFFFSALTMTAVGRAANAMIEEVRRQFREIPGLLEGTGKADYARCVEISTKGSLKEMVVPGILAVLVPVIVGWFSFKALGGLLAGALAAGAMMALFMANAGGAWDNAKKYIEGGAHGGKGSEAHKAAVVGDTVGDPFKDTSGPAINILIKLMCIVSVVFAQNTVG